MIKDEIKSRILEEARKAQSKDIVLVLDGAYVTRNSKLVYLQVFTTTDALGRVKDEFICYTHKKTPEGAKQREDVTDSVVEQIYLALTSNKFYEFTADVESFNPNSLNYVTYNRHLGFLMLTSPLYYVGLSLMQEKRIVGTATVCGVPLSQEDLLQIRKIFERQSFSLYNNLVYNKSLNRIIKRIYKANSFYNIQHTFVPLFIKVEGIYSPFHDNESFTAFKRTKLYTRACELNCIVELDGIKCYMLPHKEICLALGLSKFMRFTPDFIYKVFVGALVPDLEEFPNIANVLWVAPSKLDYSTFGLKAKYSVQEYKQLYKEMEQSVQQHKQGEELSALREKFAALQSYQHLNSLRYACMSHFKALTTIGPSVIDNRVDANMLYDIISAMRI